MPRAGDRYHPRHDVVVTIGIAHGEVGMASVPATLPGGEVVEIEEVRADVEVVFARPDRYEDLEHALVPLEHRDALWYGGYVLVIDLPSLLADFELTSAERSGKRNGAGE